MFGEYDIVYIVGKVSQDFRQRHHHHDRVEYVCRKDLLQHYVHHDYMPYLEYDIIFASGVTALLSFLFFFYVFLIFIFLLFYFSCYL